jgi:hypothetical protein
VVVFVARLREFLGGASELQLEHPFRCWSWSRLLDMRRSREQS